MFLTGFTTILEATQSILTKTADMLKKTFPFCKCNSPHAISGILNPTIADDHVIHACNPLLVGIFRNLASMNSGRCSCKLLKFDGFDGQFKIFKRERAFGIFALKFRIPDSFLEEVAEICLKLTLVGMRDMTRERFADSFRLFGESGLDLGCLIGCNRIRIVSDRKVY